jgi:hypothetical protein
MDSSTLFSTKKVIFIPRSTCKLLLLITLLAASFWLLKSCYRGSASACISSQGLQELEVTSSAYPYFAYLVEQEHFSAFNKRSLYYEKSAALTGVPPHDYYTFTFKYADGQLFILHYSPLLNEFYDPDYQLLAASPPLKEKLLDLMALYRQAADKQYGVLLLWEEANELFPKYAVAKITDIYSGASFYVQRREGSSHIDAQPLTAEDTAIMKEIYGGNWSWERKGIIVEIGGHRIAASMHGMPHGAGKIPDNDFPGHFCIHFFGSVIHGGGMDLRHHQEILKAAGKLPLDGTSESEK